MEGGTSIFADPTEIADRYHRALNTYLTELRRVVLESSVDYHRALLDESYERVLTRFLIGRAHGRGSP
jgi:hypothetical protein